MRTKKCIKCGIVKDVGEFGGRNESKDGLQSKCKSCQKEYYKKNKEQLLKQREEFYEKNKEHIEKRRKEYYKEYKDAILKYKKEHYKKNKGYLTERNKKYRKDNKEYILKLSKEYYKKNKDIILKYKKENRKRINDNLNNRYKTDPNFRIDRILRSRISKAIKNQYTSKATSSIELLGCSIAEARKHLEAQFIDNMSWDNQGLYGWHIDHIKPCASFDLTDPEQQKECFHYTNLQPLWAEENLKKGSKIDYY